MANFNVVAKLSANVKDFQSGMKTAVSSVKDFERTTGTNFQRVGQTVSNVGAGLTNAITKPAIIATTAVAGLVATMGFKRLVGIDNAKAKLTGLGYDGEQVGFIMDEVAEAIKTGMTTMDEGVNIAAGAMAAGVEQGDDLQRYIKLVGDAAVGANRDVDEMAQIFNRVQGSGKLMTQELNSIEQGMPGFSQAMADHLGVGQEEFRKMVTEGKVGSDEFLDVMEGFAGGMAEAFAGTFSGMWGNIKAYIAIIGEALVGGLFEDIKGGMEKVIEVLSSDEAYEWAERTGQKIGEFAGDVIDKVKDLIKWWNDLSPAVKDVAKKFGLFLIALGPIMQILGPLITLVGILAPIISSVAGFVGTLAFAFSAVAGGAATFGEAMLFIMGPVGWVIAGITALVAAFLYLWNTNEGFKEAVINIWESIRDFFMETIPAMVTNIIEWFQKLPERIGEFFGNILESAIEWVTGLWEKAIDIKDGFVDKIIEFIAKLPDSFEELLGFVIGFVAGWAIRMAQKAYETGTNFYNTIVEWFQQLPGRVRAYLTLAYNRAVDWSKHMWEKAKEAGSNFLTSVIDYLSKLPGRVQTWLTNTISRLTTWVTNMGSKGKEAGQDLMDKAVDGVKELPGKMATAGADVVKGFWKGITGLKDWISGKVSGFFGGIVSGAKSALKIFSPSRIFRDDVGEMVVRGFGLGIERSEKEAMNPMRKMLDNVVGLATGVKAPTLDINGTIARSTKGMNSAISHHLSNFEVSVQPAYITLRLGASEYKVFINDITKAQDGNEQLELVYR